MDIYLSKSIFFHYALHDADMKRQIIPDQPEDGAALQLEFLK
jgi:hypothetical protein